MRGQTQTTPRPEREFAFSDDQFRFLSDLAHTRTGIVLTESKRDMVYGRLVRRLRALKLNSFEDYCRLFQDGENQDEIGNLVNAITTNLTSFFREAHHFDHLREQFTSGWLGAKSKKRIRIWSAGCSSGMESYSIALTLKDALPDLKNRDARILATDIDSNMLAKGAAGEYLADDLEQIPKKYMRYIENVGGTDRIRMSDEIKKLLSFKPLNLLESWPMKGPFDVIFCRNVVIYFDKPTKEKLFDRMASLMGPEGWLYIGHSENLHNICDRFELIGRTIYQKVR